MKCLVLGDVARVLVVIIDGCLTALKDEEVLTDTQDLIWTHFSKGLEGSQDTTITVVWYDPSRWQTKIWQFLAFKGLIDFKVMVR